MQINVLILLLKLFSSDKLAHRRTKTSTLKQERKWKWILAFCKQLRPVWCHSPIHTSPNCPAPSFCCSLRDSLGISHSSCHQGFCGALDWHGFASFVHKPSGSPALQQRDVDRIQTDKHDWEEVGPTASGCTHGGDAGQVPSASWKRSWLWYNIHRCPCCGSCSAWPLRLCWGPSLWLIRRKTLKKIRNHCHELNVTVVLSLKYTPHRF